MLGHTCSELMLLYLPNVPMVAISSDNDNILYGKAHKYSTVPSILYYISIVNFCYKYYKNMLLICL